MSGKKSIARQIAIREEVATINEAFIRKKVTDIVLHGFPKWSLYFDNNDSWHSMDYDCFTNAAIYKYLRDKM